MAGGNSRPGRLPTKERAVAVRGWANTSCTGPSSMMAPASITPTRWQISLITVISWVMSTMVTPSSAFTRASSARMERVVSGSSAEVASSDSSTLGSVASARAMPTRCFCPPESSTG